MTTETERAPASDQAAGPRHRPWGWITICTVLTLALVGVTIWALNAQSDLNDQRDQTAAAQQQADDLSSQMNQLTKDVNDALAQAGQAGAAARDSLQGALADLKQRLTGLAGQIKPAATATAAAPTVTATAVENATPDGP